MVTLTVKGDWKKTQDFLIDCKGHSRKVHKIIQTYADNCIEALREATPKSSGLTSESWSYKIEKTKDGYSLEISNSNVTSQGTPVAILIQYGHATGGGGWVPGTDYINPALKPIFDEMSEAIREVATK